jgi:class 3 adenylate cyclase
MRLPLFRFGKGTPSETTPLELNGYAPALSFEGLQLGVDNLRHDVYLSLKFVEGSRAHIARLITRHGDVEALLAAEEQQPQPATDFLGYRRGKPSQQPTESIELKPLLLELHVAALQQAKSNGDPKLDLLARAAIVKFLRTELFGQHAQILERCRMTLKNLENAKHQKALEYRERVAGFQVSKKIILRKIGQELFRTLREIEKETLSRMRRSLLGDVDEAYRLFLNPLAFTEDSDPILNAELYVMLGNYEHDPDRFANVRRIACNFLLSQQPALDVDAESMCNEWLSVPENAQKLVGGGSPDESTAEGRLQKARLLIWLDLLERANVMNHIVASYEVTPLLAEYSPRINAQQLKNALLSREERGRVEKLIAEFGKSSPDHLHSAVERVAGCRGAERCKIAGRFLRDFMRYHRDLRQLEALNGAIDSVNLISNDKLRQLSLVNGTLYQYALPDEQKPAEDKVVRHVILKADVRDSSRLTRSLLERGMNPASYFSLNFYDPVNKLLAKYGATKVFLEGDAIILAILEREGETGLAAGRASVLAHEMIEIVNGYNQLLERAGLPAIELGIGISYQDSAPMYLMDGEQQIMISDALNESDRLSSCSKNLRKYMKPMQTPFRVFAFQTVSDADAEDCPDDFILKYNVSGIRMSEPAFEKLRNEIKLQVVPLKLPELRQWEECRLWSGLVPIGNGSFRKIIVRGSPMAQVDPHDFSVLEWTGHWYYEVCSHPSIYAMLEEHQAAGR